MHVGMLHKLCIHTSASNIPGCFGTSCVVSIDGGSLDDHLVGLADSNRHAVGALVHACRCNDAPA